MAEKMKVPYTHPDGSVTTEVGALIDVIESKEPWSEYALADGTKIRKKEALVSLIKYEGIIDPDDVHGDSFLGSNNEEAKRWIKIDERLEYLDEVFYEDEDEEESREKYQRTKRILLRALKRFTWTRPPFIGIADGGQIVAEWHDGRDYKIISIIPRSHDNICFSIINKNGNTLQIESCMESLEKDAPKELSMESIK
ncbi:MAG: hypothetical protein FWE09_04440 [Treponema sp.]|nr:hypothetical protein [Treponema sp.]